MKNLTTPKMLTIISLMTVACIILIILSFVIGFVISFTVYGVLLVISTYFTIRYFNHYYIYFGLAILLVLWRGYIFGTGSILAFLLDSNTMELLNGPLTKYPIYFLAIGMVFYSVALIKKYRNEEEEEK